MGGRKKTTSVVSRGRALRRLGSGVALVGVCAGLMYGAVRLRDYVRSSVYFALASVEIRGAVRASERDILSEASLPLGTNVFALDLERAAEAVEQLSWVRRASVRRVVPNGALIQVEEHEPVALLALGDLYFVDAGGEVFRAYGAGEPIDLPIILGVERAEYEAGQLRAVARVQTALSFVQVWKKTLDTAPLRAVEVGAAQLIRYQRADGTEVVVGPPPWEEALRRAEHGLSMLGAEQGSYSTVYVGRGRRGDRLTLQTHASANASGSRARPGSSSPAHRAAEER